MVYIHTLQSLPNAGIQDLFDSKYIRSVIIGVSLMVFQQFVGIGFYTSETFVQAGLSSGKLGTILYACVQVPITVVGAFLMDKSGRRPLIMFKGKCEYSQSELDEVWLEHASFASELIM